MNMSRSRRADTPIPSTSRSRTPPRAMFYLMDGNEDPRYLLDDYSAYPRKISQASLQGIERRINGPTCFESFTSIMVEVTKSSYWSLFLMGCIYMIGELGHFLIGTVSRPMAQDMEYGDQSCLPKLNLSEATADLCSDADTQIRCNNLKIVLGNGTEALGCIWNYNGLGIAYQILAGPSFIAVFTIAGLGWGYLADKFNRTYFLSLSALIFSVAIAGTAFATQYWHVVLFRMALAAGEAGCNPLASGIIADIFPASQRGLAMSLFNWGIYIGYGFSYAVGNYVTDANIFDKGWRASYVLSGLPGIIIALTFLFTVKEPPRTNEKGEEIEKPVSKKGSSSDVSVKYGSNGNLKTVEIDPSKDLDKVPQAESEKSSNNGDGSDLAICNLDSTDNLKKPNRSNCAGWAFMTNPAMIILALGACIRHFAGYTWGYNSALYFQTYYPDYDASWWLTGISIGAGAMGAAMGGYLSDRLVSRLGISARALVLATSQLIAVPFSFGLLFLDPPLAMFSLLIGYTASEMWFGVMFAVLVELVPSDVRSKAIAIILFIINNFGGNVPVIVDPIAAKYGYRTALTILYPGALLISSLLFFICWMILRTKSTK